MIGKVKIRRVAVVGTTGVVHMNHRFLVVMEQMLRHPTQISEGIDVTPQKIHHRTGDGKLRIHRSGVA
jgi:hypothetical protein